MRMRVRQLNHVLAIVSERFAFLGLNDDCAKRTVRLLESGVTMEPVCPALDDRKAIGERFAGIDPIVTDPRHTVLLIRKNQAVPVDRGRLIQIVGNIDRDVLTLFEPENRPGCLTVVTDTHAGEIAGIDLNPVDG